MLTIIILSIIIKHIIKSMKKFYTILGSMLLTGSLFAQGPADALMLSETQYEGTARSIAMGNAFTALGGDLGGMAVNPASTGVYRCNEFTFSPSFIVSGVETNFNNSVNFDRLTRMAMSNCGFVTTAETGNTSGLLNFNFGFSANRVKNFNSVITASGINSKASMLGAIASGLNGVEISLLEKTDTYEPYNNPALNWNEILAYDTYLFDPVPGSTNSYIGATENNFLDGTIGVGGRLKQDYFAKTTGGINEMTFNFGGNFNDRLYFGVNLNLEVVDYTINEYYAESALNSEEFEDGIQSFSNTYWQSTSGAGFNAKFGIIWTPAGGFRLGLTYATPTWYSLTDNWNRGMNSWFDNGNSYSQESPDGFYEYKVTAPSRFGIGAAYTFGNLGLISLDYESANYAAIKMSDGNGNSTSFSDANNIIRTGFNRSDIIRLGGEAWFGTMAVRAGYNFYGSAGTLTDIYGTPVYNYASTSFASCGLGFRLNNEGSALFDIAYQRMLGGKDERFTVFDSYDTVSAPFIDAHKSLGKIVMTLAFRF